MSMAEITMAGILVIFRYPCLQTYSGLPFSLLGSNPSFCVAHSYVLYFVNLISIIGFRSESVDLV